MCHITVLCKVSESAFERTLSLSSTGMNTLILLPATGQCICQPGAAETTAPASQFQVGCA